MRGPSVYMKSMWRDFPAHILENKVLMFLPIASLCRFRTVCKEWNMIISHPDFASSHARASSSEDYVLITPQIDHPSNLIGGWEVLDVVNNRFFTLSDDFLTKYVKQEGVLTKYIKQEGVVPVLHVPYCDWNWRIIMAADGGLFCLSYTYGFQCTISVLLVCNPVLQTVKQLPYLPVWTENYAKVVMSTDRVSMEYEIFVFIHNNKHYQPDVVHIYKSKIGRWETVFPTVPRLCEPWLLWYCASSFVKLNGFYKIFRRRDRLHPRVVFYDKLTGVASELGFDLPCGEDDDNFNLVVSKDRLFYVTIGGTKVRSVKIFEVILARKECIRFTKMPSELVNWVRGDYRFKEPILSTGCADSILFRSCIGRSVVYSLLDKSWDVYSDDSLPQAHKQFKHFFGDLYTSNNCLSLCAP